MVGGVPQESTVSSSSFVVSLLSKGREPGGLGGGGPRELDRFLGYVDHGCLPKEVLWVLNEALCSPGVQCRVSHESTSTVRTHIRVC